MLANPLLYNYLIRKIGLLLLKYQGTTRDILTEYINIGGVP